jgi:hypothetical protein
LGWFDIYNHARPARKKGEVGYTLEVVYSECYFQKLGTQEFCR